MDQLQSEDMEMILWIQGENQSFLETRTMPGSCCLPLWSDGFCALLPSAQSQLECLGLSAFSSEVGKRDTSVGHRVGRFVQDGEGTVLRRGCHWGSELWPARKQGACLPPGARLLLPTKPAPGAVRLWKGGHRPWAWDMGGRGQQQMHF